jgi:hypothetical protein
VCEQKLGISNDPWENKSWKELLPVSCSFLPLTRTVHCRVLCMKGKRWRRGEANCSPTPGCLFLVRDGSIRTCSWTRGYVIGLRGMNSSNNHCPNAAILEFACSSFPPTFSQCVQSISTRGHIFPRQSFSRDEDCFPRICTGFLLR